MVDICILDCESISDCIDEIFLALAYHFLFECLVCYSSTLAMIINLLMGADVRDTRGQQMRDDPALSLPGLVFIFLMLFFRDMVHVPVRLLIPIYSVRLFNWFTFGIVVCLGL